MYLLKLAIRPWKKAFLSQLGSVTALAVLLSVGGLVIGVEQSFSPLIRKLNDEQVVTAFLSPALDPSQEINVVDSIKIQLGARSEPTSEVRYVGNEEFLGDLKKFYPDLAGQIGAMGADAHLMIPRYVSFQGALSESELKDLRKVNGVETVETSQSRYTAIVSALTAVRWITRVVGMGLLAALFMGLFHLARVNVAMQDSALSMLALMGAEPSRKHQIHLMTGATVGFAGALIGAGLWSFLGKFFLVSVSGISPVFSTVSIQTGLFSSTAMILVAGTLLGAFSGYLASRTS